MRRPPILTAATGDSRGTRRRPHTRRRRARTSAWPPTAAADGSTDRAPAPSCPAATKGRQTSNPQLGEPRAISRKRRPAVSSFQAAGSSHSRERVTNASAILPWTRAAAIALTNRDDLVTIPSRSTAQTWASRHVFTAGVCDENQQNRRRMCALCDACSSRWTAPAWGSNMPAATRSLTWTRCRMTRRHYDPGLDRNWRSIGAGRRASTARNSGKQWIASEGRVSLVGGL